MEKNFKIPDGLLKIAKQKGLSENQLRDLLTNKEKQKMYCAAVEMEMWLKVKHCLEKDDYSGVIQNAVGFLVMEMAANLEPTNAFNIIELMADEIHDIYERAIPDMFELKETMK